MDVCHGEQPWPRRYPIAQADGRPTGGHNDRGRLVRIQVDGSRCQGHTLCQMTAPDIFRPHDENGHSYVLDENVPAAREADVLTAAAACPEDAIFVTANDRTI